MSNQPPTPPSMATPPQQPQGNLEPYNSNSLSIERIPGSYSFEMVITGPLSKSVLEEINNVFIRYENNLNGYSGDIRIIGIPANGHLELNPDLIVVNPFNKKYTEYLQDTRVQVVFLTTNKVVGGMGKQLSRLSHNVTVCNTVQQLSESLRPVEWARVSKKLGEQ